MIENPDNIISQFIDNLDLLSKPVAEHKICAAIKSFIKEKDLNPLPTQWLAEAMAFDFVANYSNKETGWGTYYGPMIVWNNQDGTVTESPSIKQVTPEIIDYWDKRSKETKNPVLKLRYADIVWDFAKIVTNRAPHFSLAHRIIDSTILIAEQNCHKYETDVIIKLKRAALIAISTNDSKRIIKLRDCIIQYEDSIAQDNKPGLWGFSFDLLINNKKVDLTEIVKEKLILDLENRLDRLSDTADMGKLDPWASEAAALRLARYYRSQNLNEKVSQVLKKFGAAFLAASDNGSALQASAWLQKVHSVYLEYGMRDEAEKIAIKLKEVGLKVKGEMKEIVFERKISTKEMDEYINSIIDSDLEITLAKIAVQYVPKRNQVENQLKDIAKKAPISYLFPHQIQDHKGRPIAYVGPLEDDLIGNVVQLTAQNMSITAIFLRRVIEELITRFRLSPKSIVEYLFQSPVFEDEKKATILEGFKAYFENNHLAALHLLIPQIENSFRRLVEHGGGSVLKPSRGGGMHLKTLDELLRDRRVVEVFGEDFTLYFRILLTDQRGWNLRNDICHGISPSAAFQVNISDRVFHIFLCLALIKEQENIE